MNQGIDFSFGYKMDISIIKSIHAIYQVLFKFEQDKVNGSTFFRTVCIGDSHYIVNYHCRHNADILLMFDDGKIIIDKNDCGEDRLFQHSIVSPFYLFDLTEMLRLIELNIPSV